MEHVASTSNELVGRRLVVVLLSGALAFAAGFFLDAITLRAILLCLLAIVAVALLSLPYSWAVRILFLYIGFEGMLKLLSRYHPAVHLGSDLLVAAMTARWFFTYLLRRVRMPRELPPLFFLFLAHYAWFLIEFFNPYALGILPSLAGFKMYVSMTLLFAFGYYLSTNKREVEWFMGAWVFLVVVQVVFGLYQAALGPISVLALSPAYEMPLRKFVGYAFRPFGTASTAGGAAVYVFMAWPFLLYFLMWSRSALLRIFIAVLIPGAVALFLFCQIRSAILKAILSTALFLVIGFSRAPREVRRRVFALTAFATVLVLVALPQLTSRWSDGKDDNAKAIERSLTAFDYNLVSKARAGAWDRIVTYATIAPFGAGLSRTGAAVEKFKAEADADPYFPTGFFGDNFWAATIAEMGIPGSLILTAIIVGILAKGFLSLRKIQEPQLFAAQTAVLCALFSIVFGLWGAEALLYNPEAAFFWFFSGVAMRFADGV